MHEYSIVQALVEQVARHAGEHAGAVVMGLRVRIGEHSGVEVDLLQTAYDTFKAGSVCAEAILEIEPVAVVWACPDCDEDIAKGDALQCAACGTPACMRQGDEIILDSIEMEVPDV